MTMTSRKETAMKRSLAMSAALAVAAGLLAFGPDRASFAQDNMREVESYACRDVMRMSGGDRDIAIAFLHGYILGTEGETAFDIDELRAATDLFIEDCLSNPDDTALEAMLRAKNP
jgi:hypothetical protein